jgi:ferredoxin-thioredoxin reductase catalytic subunit
MGKCHCGLFVSSKDWKLNIEFNTFKF